MKKGRRLSRPPPLLWRHNTNQRLVENVDALGEGLRMTNRDVSPKTCHDFHLPSIGGRVRVNNNVDAVPVSNLIGAPLFFVPLTWYFFVVLPAKKEGLSLGEYLRKYPASGHRKNHDSD